MRQGHFQSYPFFPNILLPSRRISYQIPASEFQGGDISLSLSKFETMAVTTRVILQLRNWTLIRWIRLAMGLMFIFAGIDGNTTVVAIFGAALAVSSILGLSQCDKGCPIPASTPITETKSE
jgi:hypothetical protein